MKMVQLGTLTLTSTNWGPRACSAMAASFMSSRLQIALPSARRHLGTAVSAGAKLGSQAEEGHSTGVHKQTANHTMRQRRRPFLVCCGSSPPQMRLHGLLFTGWQLKLVPCSCHPFSLEPN